MLTNYEVAPAVLEKEGFLRDGLIPARQLPQTIHHIPIRLAQALALQVCCVFPEAAFAIVQFRAFETE